MTKEWLWWLGEFGLAAVVAVVAGFVTGDVPISILYGLFVGTVFFVLRQNSRVASQFHREVSDLEDKVLNLPIKLSHLENIDPYVKRVVDTERNELLRLVREVGDGEFTLRSRPIAQVIQGFYRLVRPGDRVISATSSGTVLGTPHYDIIRQMNFESAEQGADITRVFIELTTATPEEKKRLRQEMDRQKEHLKVRFIKESHLPSGVPGTPPNIALIVDRYFGYGTYSKAVGSGLKQVVDEVRIFTRRDELEKAKEITENLIKLSEEYK